MTNKYFPFGLAESGCLKGLTGGAGGWLSVCLCEVAHMKGLDWTTPSRHPDLPSRAGLSRAVPCLGSLVERITQQKKKIAGEKGDKNNTEDLVSAGLLRKTLLRCSAQRTDPGATAETANQGICI